MFHTSIELEIMMMMRTAVLHAMQYIVYTIYEHVQLNHIHPCDSKETNGKGREILKRN